MEQQKGGRVFYAATRLTSPEDVEGAIVDESVPSPSQTTGQCAIDSIIVMLYYADGMRQAMWSWFFKNAPGGNVEIPDEQLMPRFIANELHLTKVFLLTIGARVLRILESPESRTLRRPTSARISEATHGTTPSELCSNLGVSLVRILNAPMMPPREDLVLDPAGRSSPLDYGGATDVKNQSKLLNWVSNFFLGSRVDSSLYGTFSIAGREGIGRQTSESVAMWIHIYRIESERSPYILQRARNIGHAFAVVRMEGRWYIADSNIGQLVELTGPAGAPLAPEIVDLFGTHDVYFESQYIPNEPPDDPAPDYDSEEDESLNHSEAQYFLRNRAGEVLALTAKKTMPGLTESSISREIYGIQERDGTEPLILGSRIILYWKPPGRVTPPPTAESSIMAMFGPSAAGAGPVQFAGKRKTWRKRQARRKTKHASKARPSSPK